MQNIAFNSSVCITVLKGKEFLPKSLSKKISTPEIEAIIILRLCVPLAQQQITQEGLASIPFTFQSIHFLFLLRSQDFFSTRIIMTTTTLCC